MKLSISKFYLIKTLMDVINKDSFFDDPDAPVFWNVTEYPSKNANIDMHDIMYVDQNSELHKETLGISNQYLLYFKK